MQTSAERGSGEASTGRHSDRELISRFLAARDESAFAEIVTRYSRLVMSVAQHRLRDPHAAEDAFQATFLVLARSARRIRNLDSLASWLHGTTFRVSQRLLRTRLRRKEQDLPSVELPAPWATPPRPDEQAALDEELARLSDGLRGPLVLHYLEGRTVPEIAAELRMTQSAVEGRLKRGRKMLRKRLLKRGVLFSSAVFGAGLTVPVDAGVATTLITATVAACLKTAVGPSLAPIAASTVQQMALQEMTAMTRIALLKMALLCGGVAGALGLAGAGAGAGAGANGTLGMAWGGLGSDDNVARQPLPVTNIMGDAAPATLHAPAIAQVVGEQVAEAPEGSPEVTVAQVAGESGAPQAPEADVKVIRPDDAVQVPSVRAHVEESLKQPAQMTFTGQTVEEVLHYIAAQYKMPVIAERGAMKQAGVSMDSEVNAGVKGPSLAEALPVILGSLKEGKLIFEVEDDGLHIRPRPGQAKRPRNRDTAGGGSPPAGLPGGGAIPTPQMSPRIKPIDDLLSMEDRKQVKALQEVIDQQRQIIEAHKKQMERQAGMESGAGGGVGSVAPVRPKAVDEALESAGKGPAMVLREYLHLLEQNAQAGGRTASAARSSSEIREFRPQRPPEDRIRASLDNVVDFQFTGQTLQEVLNFLATQENLNIRLDTTALTNSGVGPDTEINLVISGISLRAALKHMLKDVNGTTLDYVIEDEVMTVTTKEKADETLQTVVYDVSALLPIAPTQVEEVLERTVEPASWEGAGGKGTIVLLDNSIVVTTSRRLHEKTSDILKMLELQAKASKQ